MLRLLRFLPEHHRFILVPLVFALCSRSHRIPPEFEYSPGWISEEHPAVRAYALSGIVTDQSGAAMEHVLVDRMTPGFQDAHRCKADWLSGSVSLPVDAHGHVLSAASISRFRRLLGFGAGVAASRPRLSERAVSC